MSLAVYGSSLGWNHSQQSWEWHKQKTDVRDSLSRCCRFRGCCWTEGTCRQCCKVFVILSQELYIRSFTLRNASQSSGRILEHQIAVRIPCGIEELELGRVSLIASIFFTHFFQYGNDAVDVRIAFPRDHCMRWVETKVTLLVLSNFWLKRKKTKQTNLNLSSARKVTSSKAVWTKRFRCLRITWK